MNLKKYREAYDYFSGKASDVSRSLAFAGIAVIWIFRLGDGAAAKVPGHLVVPLALFVSGLACDLLHYVVAAFTWGLFCRLKERDGVKEEAPLIAPRQLNWLPLLLFYAKIAAIVLGYALLVSHLWGICR